MSRAPFFLTLLTAPVVTLAAQTVLPTVGQRVRLKTATTSAWLVGTLVAADTDTLRLQLTDGASLVPVARGGIGQLEVSRGRHSNAGKGAVYGAAILGSLGLIAGVACANSDSWLRCDGGAAAVAAFGGAAYGAAIGALIGALSHSERWDGVSLSVAHVALAPRGAGLALSLTF